MKQRLEYIDHIKGFAIILVVFGHVIQYNTYDFQDNRFFSAIYSFHMPLFFFLSGYIADKSKRVGNVPVFFSLVRKKVVSLLMPLFTWTLIGIFIASAWAIPLADLSKAIVEQLLNPKLWFLQTLFIVFLVFYATDLFLALIRRPESLAHHLTVLFVFVTVTGLLSISHLINNPFSFLLYCCFFMLGVFVSRYKFLHKIYMNKSILILSIFCFLLLASNYNFALQASYLQKVIKLGASAFSTISFYQIARRIRINAIIGMVLGGLGVASLAIYVIHLSIIDTLNYKLPIDIDAVSILQFASVCVLTIVWVIFCVAFQRLAALWPLLDLFLFGKQSRKPA